MGAPLQGGITFDQVQSQPGFNQETSETQAAIADAFFQKHVATQPGYSKEAPDTQQQIRQQFFQKYKVPTVAPLAPPKPVQMTEAADNSPLQIGKDLAAATMLTATGALKGASLGYADLTGDARTSAAAIGASPQLWRTTGNNLAGNVATEGGNFAGVVAPFGAAEAGLGKLGIGGLAKVAGAGGLVGGLQSLPGNQFDIGQRLQNAGEGALTAGALHLGGEAAGNLFKWGKGLIFKEPPKAPAVFKGRPVTSELPKPVAGEYGNSRLIKGNPEQIKIGQIQRGTAQIIQDASNHVGIDEAATWAERKKALKNAHDHFEEMHKQTDNPRIKAALRKAQGDLQDAYNSHNYRQLLKEERAAQARIKKLQDEGRKLQDLKDKQTKKDLIALELAESKSRRLELSKLKAAIEARAELKDLQGKQAAQGSKTMNQAEREAQERSARQLQAHIRERINAEKESQLTEGQQSAKGPENGQQQKAPTKPKGQKEVAQSQASKLKEIRTAIDKKQGLRLEYEAEKTGETGTYRFKHVSPYDLNVNKAGVIQLRAVNDEGQIRTYLLGDESGSRIVSAHTTGEASPHEAVPHPETGKITAQTREGAEVAQVKKEGVKSSAIRANLEKMKAVLESKNPSVSDIMDASKGLDATELEETLKDVPKEKLDEACKRFTDGG